MRKVAILQSNYIPWKGYFDLMQKATDFVIYDCVQYTKNDWRNRNQVKTNNGLQWLTIPVSFKSRNQLINETETSNQIWAEKHLKTLLNVYAKAKFFKLYSDDLTTLYQEASNLKKLSAINLLFLKWVIRQLEIDTNIHSVESFSLREDRVGKLVGICSDLGADVYISGPAAKNYLDVDQFVSDGISVDWMDYGNYPEYTQFGTDFSHNVSILDLLFHLGPDAKYYYLGGE